MNDPEDVMFSASVKAEQTRLGSRAQFEGRSWQTEITPDLRQFLDAIDTFFFAMIDGYAGAMSLPISTEDLHRAAVEWSVTRGGRSGRVAWQFIRDLAGEQGKPLPL